MSVNWEGADGVAAGRKPDGRRTGRAPLTRARVVDAAIDVADSAGVAGVTMRAVAAALGVEAMSLYNHVANRADLLDGMVDAVFAEIELPDSEASWRERMYGAAVSTRGALQRHFWAVGMMDSRSAPGPATLRHHDAVLGLLRRAGFSTTMAVHAVAVLDSYVYGSILQERSLPLDGARSQSAAASQLRQSLPANEYPYLAEVADDRSVHAASAPQADDEFHFGLELILQGLAPDSP